MRIIDFRLDQDGVDADQRECVKLGGQGTGTLEEKAP